MAAVVQIPANSFTFVWEKDWKTTPDDTKEFVGDDDTFFAGRSATVEELGLTPEKYYKFAIRVKNTSDHPVEVYLRVKTKETHLPPAPIPVSIKPSDVIQTIPISDELINVGGASDYVKFGILGNPSVKPTKGFFISEVCATEA
ncbi:hypothetical protein KFK09_009768 [Dendrobium nobile]|uniref:Uncharacterized protein n=1 Tax=Dendrobium nobile TaxID=94219 RepID=A0A8T3BKN4_DENNO|nr:hypothetical protein KFK09_009768 [Dendrobium nobile]